MPLRDSPCRTLPWRNSLLGIACVILFSAVNARGEEPTEADLAPLEPVWSEEFPQVETRIVWSWPALLWPDGWWTNRENEPLFDDLPAPSFGKLFGRIDWLSPAPEPSAFDLTDENVIVRADNSGLLPEWGTSQDYQITLVRGGAPQLFGARGRLRGEYGDEFDDVKRIRGQMLLTLIGNHIGIDTSVNSWEDYRPSPKALGDFWTGDANLVYSLGAQRIAMRGGLGASWVHDNDLDVGYNFTYGADLFLTRPWLVSGEVDWGRINRDKLFHWRATVGLQLFRFEVYLGYDSYKWDRIRFDGPVAGAGIWF
jgi:hypothetical protein